jgi:TldD protein
MGTNCAPANRWRVAQDVRGPVARIRRAIVPPAMTRSAKYQAPFAPGGASEVDRATCERLLGAALACGGDYADLFFEYRASGGVSFDEGIVKAASRGVSAGLGVRVQRGDATGFAYTEDLSIEAMLRAASTAAQIAASGATIAPVPVVERAIARRYELDAPTIDVSGAEKRALLERACNAATQADSRIVKAEASFAEEVREVLLVTSTGVRVFDVQPLFRFGVRCIAERDGRRQEGSSGGGGRTSLAYFEEKSPEWHGAEAARQALVMLDAREAPAGELPVVLAPGDSGILLHEAVGHGLEADFNRKGTSNYAGQLGNEVASPLCTVVDDATLLGSRGTINVDDEGHEPGRSVLIAAIPLPRMTNTVLLAGEDDPDSILRSVKRGVFAKRFGGGQVDISNGDFVFSLTESYLIEDGHLTAPLKGVNLIGNGPEVLRRVTALGHDLALSDGIWTCGKAGQSVPVGVGCPTIKIDRITVGGTRIG